MAFGSSKPRRRGFFERSKEEFKRAALSNKPQFSFTPYEPASKTFLLVCNFATEFDSQFIGQAFKYKVRFVPVTEYVDSSHRRLAAPSTEDQVVRYNGLDLESTFKTIHDALAKGICVGMQADTLPSRSGCTGAISPNLARLAKEAGVGLITYRMVGGYFCQPRWARYGRKGPVTGQVVREFTPEEVAALSVEELEEAIAQDVFVDDYAELAATGATYAGKHLAEDLDKLLYLCPECHRFGQLDSNGDVLSCKCGTTATVDELGRLSGEAAPFSTVQEWDQWQRSYLARHQDALRERMNDPIVTDINLKLEYVVDGKRGLACSMGVLEAYGDRFCFLIDEDEMCVWPYDQVERLTIGADNALEFVLGGIYYKVSGFQYANWSPTKYADLCETLR